MTREAQISDAAQMSDITANRHDLDCFVSGAGTWESNPFVWVYEFELNK